MYDPIYSANVGLCGFRCRCKQRDGTACRRVVPTYRGIVMHCKRVHGLAAQMEMAYGETKGKGKGKQPESVRVEHHEERGLFYDEHEGEFRGPNGECPHCGKTDCRCNVEVL